MEVTARPIGADQPQGANRIARGLLHVGCREFNAGGLGPGPDLVANRTLDLLPVPIERSRELITCQLRPIRLAPRRPKRIGTARMARHIRVILQALEKSLP